MEKYIRFNQKNCVSEFNAVNKSSSFTIATKENRSMQFFFLLQHNNIVYMKFGVLVFFTVDFLANN